MATETILNIKTDKKLKAEAQNLAEELGVSLTAVVNAMLKQFVREKEIVLTANPHHPNKALTAAIQEARVHHTAGTLKRHKSVESVFAELDA